MKIASADPALAPAFADADARPCAPRAAPRIVFLIRALDIGGAQRQLAELSVGLARLGWSVCVITFYGGGLLERTLKARGVKVRSLDKRGRWNVAGFTWRLAKTIREERPDVVHGYLTAPNVLLALLRPVLRGARVVWGLRASDMDLGRYDWLARLEFRVAALLSRFADLVICNSEAGRGHHERQGYRSARMIVIRNGIDAVRFRPDRDARQALRSEWGVQPHERLIGLVGRLDPVKGHVIFLEAAAIVAAARPEARFVCVGDGPAAYRDDLVGATERLGLAARLRWSGEVVDVQRVYNALDLLVCASQSEGVSNVVAEAMATGVPCVVTDVGDSAHLVGELGFVCPPEDAAALAAAMSQALSALPCDPQPIRGRILELFSTDKLLQQTEQRLCDLLEPRAAAVGTGDPSEGRR